MCLNICDHYTGVIKTKFRIKNRIRIYKRIKFISNDTNRKIQYVNVKTPFQGVDLILDKNDYLVSDRITKDLDCSESYCNQVHNGIHAYTYKPDTDYVLAWGYQEDFIAAGRHSDVVFAKIKIDPKELQKSFLRWQNKQQQKELRQYRDQQYKIKRDIQNDKLDIAESQKRIKHLQKSIIKYQKLLNLNQKLSQQFRPSNTQYRLV
jgi:hypothetical protein